MRTRIITAVVMAVFGIPLLILSQYIAFPIAMAALCALACWEVMRLFGFHKKPVIFIPTYIIATALPIFTHSIFFGSTDSLFGSSQHSYVPYIMFAIFGYMVYLIGVAVFSRRRISCSDIAELFMMVSYVTIAFTAVCATRYMPNGGYLFLLPIIGAWMCDSFAYFSGMLFGKHKLAPEISPKKTIEGAIGGAVMTFIAFMVYGLIVDLWFEPTTNFITLGILGVIIPVVGQIGDLWASLIKREHGIKDYSRILPGHGGIIDRFDSIFATSIVMFFVSLVFPIFT